MKILITGGAGFIGLNLAREFGARGHAVTLLDSFARGARDAELQSFVTGGPHTVVEANLLTPGALTALPGDFDIVCHLAAILGVEKVRREPLSVLRDNVLMNLEVLRFAAEQKRLHRLVFASTSEVYAGTLEKFSLAFPTIEATPLALPDLAAPRTSYMLSKIYGEALAQHSGLPFTIIRPHNIYGPRMGLSHVVPQLMQRIWQTPAGGEVKVHSPEHRRTFCYVEDAARLVAAAAEAAAGAGATLNIGNTLPEVTMGELARQIAGVLGRKVKITDGEITPGSPERRQPDTRAVVGLTGVEPRVSLAEGLQRTFAWYRKHVFEAPANSVKP